MLLFLSFAPVFGQKAISKFLSKKRIRLVNVVFPETLNFTLRKKVSAYANARIFEPAFALDLVIASDRFVSRNYLNVFFVKILSGKELELEVIKKELKEKISTSEHILEEGVKRQGTSGYWWKIKHRFSGATYIKYIAVFGDKDQSVYLAGVYPIKFERTFIPDAMKTTLFASTITDQPFER